MKFSWPSWAPDWLRRFPWLSLFLPVLVGIAGLVGTLIIRYKAIGHPVSAWSYWFDPQMALSMIGTVSSIFLTFGFKGGAKISFWVRARKGMTLSDIHYAWESTTSVVEAAKAIRRGKSSLTAWLSIIFTISIPASAFLLGHSIYQDDVVLGYNGTATMHITPTIISPRTFPSVFATNHAIMTAYREYLTGTPTQFPLEICGKCSVDTLGFGWSEICSVSTGREYNFEAVRPGEGPQTLFSTEIGDESTPSGYLLTVNTTYKSGDSCAGNYVTEYCVLTASMVQYRMNITGNSTTYTTVTPNVQVAMNYPMFFDLGPFLPLNRHSPTPAIYDERLQLFTKLGKSLYGTEFGAVHEQHWWAFGDDAFGMGYQSHIAAAYAHKPSFALDSAPEHPCKLGFKSPMDDILGMYRQLALRVSIIAAIHMNETQSVPYSGERTERQWLADKERAQLCFYTALITLIAGVLVVLVLHWGFWKLPRVYSMSPLELLNSFAHRAQSPQSPLHILAEADDDASVSKLKKFADGWDDDHDEEEFLVYRKGPDGRWGWEVKVEELELAELAAARE